MFLDICGKIKSLDSQVDIVACFESLCGVRSVLNLLQNFEASIIVHYPGVRMLLREKIRIVNQIKHH